MRVLESTPQTRQTSPSYGESRHLSILRDVPLVFEFAVPRPFQMKSPGSRFTPAVLSVLIAAMGCSRAAQEASTTPRPALPTSDAAAIERARVDSARKPYVQADIDFMSNMIGHHAQALTMSRWAATHGANPSVRILAERIINGQQDDIVLMQQWLSDRRQPVPVATLSGRMAVNGHEHEHLMPGMLNESQMRELDRARGSEFDRLFLKYMIQHHGGAVVMVKELFGTYGAGQNDTVFKFASDVNVDQTTEIARMEKMLAELQP
jgi:uncharacterized protein (DUF305 family)